MGNSTTKKVLVGIFTLVPLIAIVLYVAFFFGVFMQALDNDPYLEEPSREMFISLFVYLGIAVLSSIGLLIFYCIDAFRNPMVKQDMRVIWLLIFFFGGIIGMVVYYFLYILKDPPPASAKGSDLLS